MTQCEKIIDYMERFGSITPLDAFVDLGVMRLSARIYDIRNSGTPVRGEIESRTNRFGDRVHYMRYSLKGEK